MKRKPDKSSFHTDYTTIEGASYEMAHFDTIPFESIEEFRQYRKAAKSCTVLRTEADWETFWKRIGNNTVVKNKRITDMSWTKLVSVVMGYRAKIWSIPALDNKTVEEKCNYINSFNLTDKVFTQNDRKNAGRPERQAKILPENCLHDFLCVLQSGK